MPVDADEGGIGRAREIGDGTVGPDAADLALAGVNGPDLAGKAHLQRLLDHGCGLHAAEHGDGARTKESLEALALENAKVREVTDGRAIAKVIVVPGKLVNVVAK